MHSPRLLMRLVFVFALGALALLFAQSNASHFAFAANPDAAPAAANWVTTGNSVGNKDFIGTTNNKPLVFKTNKAEQMRILSNGNVGIGTNAPGSRLTVAGLIESTNGGFKFPDGTTQTTANTGGASGWGLGGNAGTNPASNFVGTTDNQPLILRTKGYERLRIATDGNIGIGTSATDVRLLIHTPSGYPGWRHTDGVMTLGSYLGASASGATGGWLGTVSNHDLHFFTNNGQPSQTIKPNGNVGIGTSNPTSKLEIAAQDGLAITGYQPFLTLRDNNASNARGRIQSANGDILFWSNSFIGGNPPLVLKNNSGNVGIGTSAPAQSLEVNGVTSMGQAGGVYGYRVSGGGLSYPTLGFNTYGPLGGGSYLAGATGHGSLLQYQNNDGKLIYYTGTSVGAGAARTLTPRLVINAAGNIGIGQESANDARVSIKGISNNASTSAFRVHRGDGIWAFAVRDDGMVGVQFLRATSSSTHICLESSLLSDCEITAYYVPSIDTGKGYPETGELVSMMLTEKNPYEDSRNPFAVHKSSLPCDPNVMGFISDPALGADGKKVNDHYLPLVSNGVAPVKVSLENGTILRGDALTSSSKPGYAMKATGACKIIGYALENAYTDGQIQVFANLGDNSSSEIAALKQENQMLKDMLAEMDARLRALEQNAPVVYESAAETR